MKTLLASIAALALAAPTATAHHDHRFGFGLDLCGPRVRIGPVSLQFGGCRPVHRHCWRTVCEQEWVAPLWQDRIVGFDGCRRPIWQPMLVRP